MLTASLFITYYEEFIKYSEKLSTSHYENTPIQIYWKFYH